jgi:hypothetical protein
MTEADDRPGDESQPEPEPGEAMTSSDADDIASVPDPVKEQVQRSVPTPDETPLP